MQINKNYEREIDLKDLFFHLLYHWRSILVAAVIFAILLGTRQYLNLEQTHKKGKLTKAEKQYEVDLQAFRDKLQNARNGVKTYTIPSSELSRGRGGPRCMSMPLVRDLL